MARILAPSVAATKLRLYEQSVGSQVAYPERHHSTFGKPRYFIQVNVWRRQIPGGHSRSMLFSWAVAWLPSPCRRSNFYILKRVDMYIVDIYALLNLPI